MIGLMCIITLLLIVIIGLIDHYRKEINKLNQTNNELYNSIKEARIQAVKQSKSVIGGQINENIVPLFEEFPYNLSDIKFSGQPLDYLVFDGMTELRNNGSESTQISIIFADVKTNTASNTKVQNAIKNAISEGRVRFESWKIKNNKLIIK